MAQGHLRAHLRSVGQPIGPNDLWIAAHALTLDVPLVTHNLAEFRRVPGPGGANLAGRGTLSYSRQSR